MKPSARTPEGDGGRVVDIHSRPGYKPDLGALARQQMASARRRLALTPSEFGEVLGSVLGWTPSGAMIESWENAVVPPGDVMLAAGLATQTTPRDADGAAGFDVITQLVGRRFADVDAVYATRSEFTSHMPPHALFGGATEIRAVGLSLNLICQQYADDDLRRLIENGGSVRCLFLDPHGESIKAREREEGYQAGHLSALTDMNIQILQQRVRRRLSANDSARLVVATY